MRSDFLGAINQHPELSRLIARQNVIVPVMGEDELRRAIEEPAKRAGREIDRSTVDLLIEQTLGREGALPAAGVRPDPDLGRLQARRLVGGYGAGAGRRRRRPGQGGRAIYESLSDDQKADHAGAPSWR